MRLENKEVYSPLDSTTPGPSSRIEERNVQKEGESWPSRIFSRNPSRN